LGQEFPRIGINIKTIIGEERVFTLRAPDADAKAERHYLPDAGTIIGRHSLNRKGGNGLGEERSEEVALRFLQVVGVGEGSIHQRPKSLPS